MALNAHSPVVIASRNRVEGDRPMEVVLVALRGRGTFTGYAALTVDHRFVLPSGHVGDWQSPLTVARELVTTHLGLDVEPTLTFQIHGAETDYLLFTLVDERSNIIRGVSWCDPDDVLVHPGLKASLDRALGALASLIARREIA